MSVLTLDRVTKRFGPVTVIDDVTVDVEAGRVHALLGENGAGKEVKVFGFDGTEDGLKAIKAGTLAGTIAQQPKELGKKAVEFAAKLVKGESVDAVASVPVTTITSANVGDFLK